MKRRTFLTRCASAGAVVFVSPTLARTVAGHDAPMPSVVLRPEEHRARWRGDHGWVEVGGLGAGPGQLNFPVAVVQDRAGLRYVSERGNHRVSVFAADGQFVRTFGADALLAPRGLAWDADGHLLVCDGAAHHVCRFNPRDGVLVDVIGEFGISGAGLNHPRGVVLDPASGELHVADAGNRRVAVFSRGGRYQREYGAEHLSFPREIAIDDEGAVAVLDATRRRALRFMSSGRLVQVHRTASLTLTRVA